MSAIIKQNAVGAFGCVSSPATPGQVVGLSVVYLPLLPGVPPPTYEVKDVGEVTPEAGPNGTGNTIEPFWLEIVPTQPVTSMVVDVPPTVVPVKVAVGGELSQPHIIPATLALTSQFLM